LEGRKILLHGTVQELNAVDDNTLQAIFS